MCGLSLAAWQAHKMFCDQIVNRISSSFSDGHLGLDNRLQYITQTYVWGVTMEKRDANKREKVNSTMSLKYRVLLIRKVSAAPIIIPSFSRETLLGTSMQGRSAEGCDGGRGGVGGGRDVTV